MAKTPDLRNLKDKATKALEKRNYAKAAEAYLEIAQLEDDPDWRQRAGEALRKVPKPAEAAEQFVMAAEGYARSGFLLKAIAVCKVVLQLEPSHTTTQRMLADLYAQRDGGTRTPSGRVGLVEAPVTMRTESGNFAVAPAPPPPRFAPPPRPAPAPSEPLDLNLNLLNMGPVSTPVPLEPLPIRRAPEPSLAGPPPLGVEPIGLAGLPRLTPSPPPLQVMPAMPPGAPMDVLPLASMLGGRRSSHFQAVEPTGAGDDGSAYEIPLDESIELEELPLDSFNEVVDAESRPQLAPLPRLEQSSPAIELTLEAEFTQLAAPMPPSVRLPARPPADELDFSDVMDDAPPAPPPLRSAPPVHAAPPTSAPPPRPAPAPPPRAPLASIADELDFSDVMDDAPPPKAAPAPLPAPEPPPELPKIPLFSSLTAEELMHVIDGVEVRDFERGETIVRQGDRGVALYVIVRGQVEVLLEGPPRRIVAMLTEGAFFGELALLTDFPRSATVVAQEATQCLEISRELIASVIADSPDVLKTMLRFFRDRMLDRLLATSPVFSRFAPDDAKGLLARFKFLELDPRVRVVVQGQQSPGLFLLLCGDLAVVQGHQKITQVAPGDLFGEMSLLVRGPAMASVETESKCWVLQLLREDFQEIMLTYPQLLEFVSEVVDKRQEQNLGDSRVEFL